MKLCYRRTHFLQDYCWGKLYIYLCSKGTGEDWVYGWLIDTGEGGSYTHYDDENHILNNVMMRMRVLMVFANLLGGWGV